MIGLQDQALTSFGIVQAHSLPLQSNLALIGK